MKISSGSLNSPLFAMVLRNQSLSLFSGGGLLDLLHDVLNLLTDLGGKGGDHVGQLVDLAFQGGAQFLGGGLQLGLDALSLGLQLQAQVISLGLQHGGDVTQLLGCGVTGLLDEGLNILLHGVDVLGGAGLELTHIGGHSAWGGQKREDIYFSY